MSRLGAPSETVAVHWRELVKDTEFDVKLNTTLGVALIGGMVMAGIGWMALPSLQASRRTVNADAAMQIERARRLLHKFNPILERESLLLDRLATADVDVNVEDPEGLPDAAADFYQEQHETAWKAYQPMDWEDIPPSPARASYGNIERQMRDALANRDKMLDFNDQWLDEAIEAVNQALALQHGDADSRSNTEANRLKSVIHFHQGLTTWLQADAKRQEATEFKQVLADVATRMAGYQAAQTIVEDSGIVEQIRQLGDGEREALDAIAKHKERLTEAEGRIAVLERQLADAKKDGQEAEAEMTSLRDRGVDFADPEGMAKFKTAFMTSERAYRNAHRRIQLLQSGDFTNAKIDRSGDFLNGRYVENGSGRSLTITLGLGHYRREREVLSAEIGVLEDGLADHRAAIDRLEGLRSKLRTDGELASQRVSEAVVAAAAAFDEMNRLDSEAFAFEQDALDDLDQAARSAKLAAGSARTDLSDAGDRLRAVSMEARDKSAFSLRDKERWIGGHITAQVADARLAKSWIYYDRYVAYTRNAVLLEKFGALLQLREADSESERTKASEAHDAGVGEIEQVMTQLRQAHRDSKKHWTFVAQQGAVNHLMAMFGHAEYLADAISSYRNAVTGREDQTPAKPFVTQLNRLEGR